MELFILLAVIGIINSVVKNARRQQQTSGNQDRGAGPDRPWQRMLGDLAETIEKEVTGKKQQPIKTTIPPISGSFPPPPSALQEGDADDQEGYRPVPGMSAVSSQPGEGVSLPQTNQWHGSLPGTEGAAAMTAYAAPAPDSAEPASASPNGLGLSLAKDDLVRAVVMSEILTRPQDRRRRWAGH